MRKIIILTVSLFVLAACKKSEITTEETTTTTADSTAVATAQTLPGCDLMIAVDLDKIADPAERAAWVQDNDEYYCTPQTATAPSDSCSTNKVTIDLNAIEGVSAEDSFQKQSQWLAEFGRLICYEETYCSLEQAHRVSEAMTTKLESEVEESQIKWMKRSDIIAKINEKADYDNDKYNHYVFFSYSLGQLMVSVDARYNGKYACFSIPFLRSISICNQLHGADPLFGIFEYKPAGSSVSAVYLKVKTVVGGKLKYVYYDYSQVPGKSNAKIMK